MSALLDFFARDTLSVARDLIGMRLRVGKCSGKIVETEAYTTDAASHTVTRRHTASLMRETFGHIYVYKIYGMHWCLNFTTEQEGIGAVLIRALQPLTGLAQMAGRRGVDEPRQLLSGPGRLCQGLGIDYSFHGEAIGRRLKLLPRQGEPEIGTSPRIGISAALDLPWRFFEVGNPFVSRAPRRAQRIT